MTNTTQVSHVSQASIGLSGFPDKVLHKIFSYLMPDIGRYSEYPNDTWSRFLELRLICKRIDTLMMTFWLQMALRRHPPRLSERRRHLRPQRIAHIEIATRMLTDIVKANITGVDPLDSILYGGTRCISYLSLHAQLTAILKTLFRTGLISAAVITMGTQEVMEYVAKVKQLRPRPRGCDTALVGAAKIGAILFMKLLIEKGANVNYVHPFFGAPLHAAAHGFRSEALDILLDHGADPSIQTSKKETPLHFAALSGNAEAIEILLETGVDANPRNDDGDTPLMWAAAAGHADAVRAMLGCESVDQHLQNDRRMAPLHLAMEAGHGNVIMELLGADIKRYYIDFSGDGTEESYGTGLYFL